MSTKTYSNCEEIIARAKIFLNVHTGKDLAHALGVSENAISTWKKRGTLDIGKILLTCEGINQEWLITGKGESETLTNPEASEEEMLQKELLEAYRQVASMSKTIIERDDRIFELERELANSKKAIQSKKKVS